jgi:hypothetical protein
VSTSPPVFRFSAVADPKRWAPEAGTGWLELPALGPVDMAALEAEFERAKRAGEGWTRLLTLEGPIGELGTFNGVTIYGFGRFST